MKAIMTNDLLEYRRKHEEHLSAEEWYGIIKTGSVPMEEVKKAKIAALRERCEQEITAGFQSKAAGHAFGLKDHDQMNFTQQLLMFVQDASLEAAAWKTESDQMVELDRKLFLEVCKEAEHHKRSRLTKFWMLKEQVEAAGDLEQVERIKW